MTRSVLHSDGLGPRKLTLECRHDRLLIADCIEALAGELRSTVVDAQAPAPLRDDLVSIARTVYAARRKIDEIFEMNGFAVSPAWDIMLDLYQASIQNREISISSASIGAACPPTTALRWLHALEAEGLLRRCGDPADKRRSFVRLTDEAKEKIERALCSIS